MAARIILSAQYRLLDKHDSPIIYKHVSKTERIQQVSLRLIFEPYGDNPHRLLGNIKKAVANANGSGYLCNFYYRIGYGGT